MGNIIENSKKKFYLMNGQVRNYIVNYPYLHFGAVEYNPQDYSGENTLIYNVKMINETKNPYETLFSILKDANLMRYGELTNYWNVKKDATSYVGSGLVNLKKCIDKLKTNDFFISFGSEAFLFNFYTEISNNKLVIDLCVNNEEFPYVDIINPIRKSSLDNGSFIDKNEIIKENKIRKFWISDMDIDVQVIGHLYEKNIMEIKYPIIKNIYVNNKQPSLNNISKYITYSTRFNLLFGKKPKNIKYKIIMEIWEIDNNNIISVDIEDYFD